jgi:hypothetical protein
VKDTREQTRQVFWALADEQVEEPDRERWHALQAWLDGAEHRVTIPYAGILAGNMGDVAVRLRRDFSVVLSLTKAHTILHQASREKDAEGQIVATLDDYAHVRRLVSNVIAEGVEATVPKTVRETVEVVRRLVEASDEEWATNKAAASRCVKTAIRFGYLRNLEDRKGHPACLMLGEAMPKDQEILPTLEDLEEALSGCALDRDSWGLKHPPPPLSGCSTASKESVGNSSSHDTTGESDDEWGVV